MYQCNHCDYKSRRTWCINRHSLEKHGIQRNHYGAPDSLPKKVETIEYDKKLLEESQEVLKIYKLLQRMIMLSKCTTCFQCL